MQLHQHILKIINEKSKKEDLEDESLWNFINMIESIGYRIIENTDVILETTYKIKAILLDSQHKPPSFNKF